MKAFVSLFFIWGITISPLLAQSGGKASFNSINLPAGAYGAALGGVNNLSSSNDPNAIFYNPASIHKDADNNIGLSYTPYLGGVTNSNVAYTKSFKTFGLLSFGLQYLNYGSFTETNESGNEIGTFQARDYAFLVGKSHTIGVFTMGGSVKFAGSHMAGYSAFATMVDVGGFYKHQTEDLKIGLVVKNIGVVFKNYLPDSQSSTPFDVQISGRFKPAHMPVRVNVTAVSLTNYDFPENAYLQVTNETQQRNLTVVDQIGRHFILGAELILSRNFNLVAAYNIKRRQLRLEEKGGFTGLNLGAMVKSRAIQAEYAYSFYYSGIGIHSFTLLINTKSLFTKRVTGPIEI
jgi:hypothetical protein